MKEEVEAKKEAGEKEEVLEEQQLCLVVREEMLQYQQKRQAELEQLEEQMTLHEVAESSSAQLEIQEYLNSAADMAWDEHCFLVVVVAAVVGARIAYQAAA